MGLFIKEKNCARELYSGKYYSRSACISVGSRWSLGLRSGGDGGSEDLLADLLKTGNVCRVLFYAGMV